MTLKQVSHTAFATHTHKMACQFATTNRDAGRQIRHHQFFDKVVIDAPEDRDELIAKDLEGGFNLRPLNGGVAVTFDETSDDNTLFALIGAICGKATLVAVDQFETSLPSTLEPRAAFMTRPVFHKYHTETEMMRYMRQLADRDLALDRCMIPLGPCTMKLNATAEMMPISWPEFATIHPYSPAEKSKGIRS